MVCKKQFLNCLHVTFNTINDILIIIKILLTCNFANPIELHLVRIHIGILIQLTTFNSLLQMKVAFLNKWFVLAAYKNPKFQNLFCLIKNSPVTCCVLTFCVEYLYTSRRATFTEGCRRHVNFSTTIVVESTQVHKTRSNKIRGKEL